MKALVAVSLGYRHWPSVVSRAAAILSDSEISELVGVGIPQVTLGSLSAVLPSQPRIETRDIDSRSRLDASKLLRAVELVVVFWDGETMSNVLYEARRQRRPTRIVPVDITKVVNKDKGDYFDVFIGRPSQWGNPFRLGVGGSGPSREEVVALYREHFEKNILSVPRKKAALLAMRGMRLGCHCKPLACHGDVLAEYLNNLDPDAPELMVDATQAALPLK